MNSREISRFVLIGVMAKVLKHLLQINFNFVECFDGINPTQIIGISQSWIGICPLTWVDGMGLI